MTNSLIVVVALILTTTVGISDKTSANPSGKDAISVSQKAEQDCNTFKPEAFYGFALTSPTKSRAMENLKKAEQCYQQEDDLAGVEKVRNKIVNIETIDFAANRKDFLDTLKRSAEYNRKQGNLEEAAKTETQIRELEQGKD